MRLLTFFSATWVGVRMLLKWLVLAQCKIGLGGTLLAIVGAPVVPKVVVVMEHSSLSTAEEAR